MKKQHLKYYAYILIAVVAMFSCIAIFAQTTRDSIVATTFKVTHDTTVRYAVTHDTIAYDTIKIPVITPVDPVRGMYISPSQLTIGNTTSETTWINYGKAKNANVFNLYARSFLTTPAKQAQLASFCRRLKSSGSLYVTVDYRDAAEAPNWQTFYNTYPDLKSFVHPLTEKEPWRFVSPMGYDYTGTFKMLRAIRPIAEKVMFYVGWMGKYYSNPQAAVDSMVKYCDVIYISNYVSMSDYQSTSSSLGPWDSRMKKRIDQGGTDYGGITKACTTLHKTIGIVEIISLEPDFLFNLFACPASSTKQCKTYYGSTYDKAVSLYNLSNAPVLQYTDLVGRTMFYSNFLQQAQP